jgi:nucleoside-diphosphate-sugar epimerase
VPRLLGLGLKVIAVDTFWFGDHLADHKNLSKINRDIRDLHASDLPEIHSIIHLAAVANDPSVDLDPTLSWEIGCLGTRNLCEIGLTKKIDLFVLASSGSVYGIKSEPKVTENLELVPISVYNKVKMVKERITLSYRDSFRTVVYRPATICGYSPRLRLDLAVNALTISALTKGEITVFGGEQLRPQLHIDDMVRAYEWALSNPSVEGIYNIGFENDSILEIAKKVQGLIQSEIRITSSNDLRSYRLDSTKILKTGFIPLKKSVDAITEIKECFENNNLKVDESNFNVTWMAKLITSGSIR